MTQHAPAGQAATQEGAQTDAMGWRQQLPVTALFALQTFCAIFFLLDDLPATTGLAAVTAVTESDRFEAIIIIALFASVAYTGYHLVRLMKRNSRIENQLKVASGAFAELLDQYFEEWKLTPSERDIALLAIKGYSLAEMAEFRDTRPGTIKAQCNAIYRKAGVSGRPELLSLFIEELVAEGLSPATAAA